MRAQRRLIIVWHSRTGATKQLVEAMLDACRDDEIELCAIPAEQAQASDLLEADAIIFACPENLGSMSGGMKEFFDRCYYPLLDQISGKPYAAVIVAGSDGTGALRQLQRIVTGWRLRAIVEAIIVITHAQSSAEILAPKQLQQTQLDPALELAKTLAAGVAAGIY